MMCMINLKNPPAIHRNVWILLVYFAMPGMFPAASAQQSSDMSADNKTEIIYHVFQRSFYDSNGDRHGDLPGLETKLDYLQELGVTSILLLPLYESVYYHNYFPIDFRTIDPEFGTEADFVNLVKEVHRRGMRIYMDMEIQYITEDHLWYRDSYKNPESEYTDHLIYNGPGNTEPETIIFNLTSLTGYDGVKRNITTLNLNNPEVKRHIYDLFHYWLDPNQDGNFDDGVDGFRIDHMMDDLDLKGLITNMFADFWKPLFDALRARNPGITLIGEQADWTSFGTRHFDVADLDRVFAFGIKFGISSFDKHKIVGAFRETIARTPEGKNQIIFIENHDTHRFATEVQGDPGKLRVGAAFNLLGPGIPSIYYGQEIGMRGEIDKWPSAMDGNHIPAREAFQWHAAVESPGTALWYKDSGPWWDETTLKDGDGISVEEQQADAESLWNFYRTCIALRRANPALSIGDMQFPENQSESVVSFVRSTDNQRLLVNINLSGEDQSIEIGSVDVIGINTSLENLLGSADPMTSNNAVKFALKPYEVQIVKFGKE